MRKRRHQPRRCSPTSWAEVLGASCTLAPGIADEAMAKLYSAFADLKAGATDDELFDRLAVAINVGMIRAEQIGAEQLVAAMLAGRDALIRCDEIRGRHGRYGFDGPGIQGMAAALEVYEEILRKSTPMQMRAAMTESLVRMRAQA